MVRKSGAAKRAAAASEAAARKRQATTSAAVSPPPRDPDAALDPEWLPPSHEHSEGSDAEPELVQVGRDTRRDQCRKRKALSRERLRNESLSAGSLLSYFKSDMSDAVKAVARAACEAAVERARRADVARLEAEQLARRKRERDAQRERRSKWMKTQLGVGKQTRKMRTFAAEEEVDHKSKVVKSSQKQQRKLTPAMIDNIHRIAHARELQRSDVHPSVQMTQAEWSDMKTDQFELRKIYAVEMFVRLRKESGKSARACYTEAAQCMSISKQNKAINWQTLRRWVVEYAGNGGCIRPSRRGRVQSSRSFLADNEVRAAAVAWVSEKLKKQRRKNSKKEQIPFRAAAFLKYVNTVLLKPLLEADRRRRPIKMNTALSWLRKLGFKYKQHTKTIYFDGHERDDVVRDRKEKLVMLAVLDEVMVKFGGLNCEEVIWPKLNPGEPGARCEVLGVRC